MCVCVCVYVCVCMCDRLTPPLHTDPKLNADVAPFCHLRQACVCCVEMQNDCLFSGCLLVCSIEETEPKSFSNAIETYRLFVKRKTIL